MPTCFFTIKSSKLIVLTIVSKMLLVAMLVLSLLSASTAEVRLVSGTNNREGRVEVFADGFWGTVCDDSWDINDADVVCRTLGYEEAIEATSRAHFGPGTGNIVLDDVQCTGTESHITECTHGGPHDCSHSEDAGVRCARRVRLVDGTSSNEGQVEVYYNGGWGTVCDDAWGDDDADVVCRSLGFGEGGTATTFSEFGEGTGDITLDEVQCTGTESDIFDCPHAGLGINDCSHYEDAGVRCEQTVRLVGGTSDLEGRVEVLRNGAWGTVCDDWWGITDANVVCGHLGLGEASVAYSRAFFGEGSGDILLDNVDCSGTESTIFECTSNAVGDHNCDHSEDAGVGCIG